MKSELVLNYEQLMDIYADLKRDIKLKNPLFFERWKAGGFIIDEDILSMYPHLGQCPEIENADEDEDEDWLDEEVEEIEEVEGWDGIK